MSTVSQKRPTTVPRISTENFPTRAEVLYLRMFAKLSRQLGRPPSFAELSEALGLTSRNGCQTLMRKLEAKGLISACTLTKTKGVVTKHQRVTAAGERWL